MADRCDKFTDRARRALQIAQQEAVRLGHGSIVADHLLLGLLNDRTSVAAHALARLEVDLVELASKAAAQNCSRDPPQAQVGLAASAKQTIELAVDEARGLDHHYVGTEHLLLGLLRQGRSGGTGHESARRRGVDHRTRRSTERRPTTLHPASAKG